MLAAAMIAALTTVAMLGVSLGAAIVVRHRAQAAADLAALAAANTLGAGPVVACGRATEIASAMGGSVTACSIIRLDVRVAVSVPAHTRFGGTAHAAARAGPQTTP